MKTSIYGMTVVVPNKLLTSIRVQIESQKFYVTHVCTSVKQLAADLLHVRASD